MLDSLLCVTVCSVFFFCRLSMKLLHLRSKDSLNDEISRLGLY